MFSSKLFLDFICLVYKYIVKYDGKTKSQYVVVGKLMFASSIKKYINKNEFIMFKAMKRGL